MQQKENTLGLNGNKEKSLATLVSVKSLGIASNSAEARSAAIVKGSDNKFYALLPSLGFLVCYDFEKGTSTQHVFKDNGSGAPFKSFASQKGRFYTGANQYFYEFDPVADEYTAVIHMGEWDTNLTGWGFCEDDDGIIYFANYPKLYMFSFDPNTKKIKNFGLIDDTQMYCFSQAADSKGWVYSAIGTAEVNVVGINVVTGERKYMFPRIPGTGSAVVYKTKTGAVAVKMSVDKVPADADSSYLDAWYIVDNGEIKEKVDSIEHYYVANYPWGLHIPYENAPVIEEMDYPAHTFTHWNPVTQERKTVQFVYDCEGANCSPITLGPDSIVYGTTNHPMNIFTIDPATDTLIDHGIKSIGKGVGNICCYAYQNDILVGAAYCGGFIYRIDTKLGIVNEKSNVSPKEEAVVEAIERPRSALALSDGDTCLFSGYGGYGVVGSGMAVYSVKTGETTVLENKGLLEYHGILAMAELPNGNVLCGSTCIPHGGAKAIYNTAALFEFNPKTRQIGNITYPFENVSEIAHLVWAKSAVHGITTTGIYFVYDYEAKKVICQTDLRSYGSVVRQGMVYKHDSVILLMSGALLQIDPSDYSVHCIGKLSKASSGIAVTDDAVYYCSGPLVYKATVQF